MAERITASCQSAGTASVRTHSCQYVSVEPRNSRASAAGDSCRVSSGPMTKCSELFEHHRPVLEQRGQRCVGGHAVVQPVGREADVMTAGDAGLAAFAETCGGSQPQTQGRPAGERLHAAHEHHRPEHAATAAKSRREIDDAHGAAMAVVQPRLDDRGVAHVVLLGARQIDHVDGENTAVRFTALFLQQRGEHRIAIRAWQAGPHEPRLLVDERRHLAIADHSVVHGYTAFASWSNHCRTAAGPGSHHSALTRGPTAMASPSKRRTASKPP